MSDNKDLAPLAPLGMVSMSQEQHRQAHLLPWHTQHQRIEMDALQRCQEPCCVERREREEAWKMLTELYRVLVCAGSGSAEKRHVYRFNRRKASL